MIGLYIKTIIKYFNTTAKLLNANLAMHPGAIKINQIVDMIEI
jgi:hypothetical protein